MENLHPNQTTIYDFLPKLSNDKKIELFEKLVIELKNDIQILKDNKNFNDSGKIQTVCVLRECINKMENILNATK